MCVCSCACEHMLFSCVDLWYVRILSRLWCGDVLCVSCPGCGVVMFCVCLVQVVV